MNPDPGKRPRALSGPAVVFGGTGLIGGYLLNHLAEAGDVDVQVPGRRAPGLSNPRVHHVGIDFEAWVETPPVPDWFEGVSTTFICLGTTLKRAGSKDAFRRVDLDYVAAAAKAARAAGVTHLIAVSSVGASVSAATFYLRVKGQAEQALRELEFPALTLARPSLLLGDRDETRPGEKVAGLLLGLAAPLLRGPLSSLRPIAADSVARALLAAARDRPRGVQILEPDDLRRLARR